MAADERQDQRRRRTVRPRTARQAASEAAPGIAPASLAPLFAALTLTLALALTLALSSAGPALADDSKDHPTPSGLPVPRYVSLKFDSVNARAGPSDDHRLLWVFHARGLPVQVIAETEDWRRVCDPDGQVSWVHRRTTDGRRMVMRTQAGAAPILASPRAKSPVVAYLAPRALAALDRCQNDWCKIKVGAVSGWAAASDLWGAADAPQCR